MQAISTIQEFLPDGARERLRPAKPLSYTEWLAAANYTIDGRVCDLNRVPYMRKIYEDDSPEIVVRKPSQAGASAWAVGRVCHGADQRGMRWMYFLPTDGEMDDFVRDRVRGVINASDYLRSRIGDTDTLGLMSIGPGLAYFRGLWTMRRAKSVPVDGLVFDEVDELKPENIAFGEDRTLASDWDIKLYLSVPSFSNYGIDAKFRETDQSYYQIKCGACGRWNEIDKEFPAHFLEITPDIAKSHPDGATHYRGCRHCRAELDVSNGEWVADYPGRRSRGYHLSQLLRFMPKPGWPNVATWLMAEFASRRKTQEGLKNWTISYLGRPFDGEGARITDEKLLALESGYGFFYTGHGTVMGVDQANRLHVSIYQPLTGGYFQLLYCECTEDWDRVSALFRKFNCFVAGCDRVPDVHSARGFAAQFKGRVFLIDYGGDQIERQDADGRNIKRRVKQDLHKGKIPVPWVSVDRTSSLDETVDMVDSGHLLLPDRTKLTGDDRIYYDEYRQNLTNLKWKFEDTPSGRNKVYLKKIENHQGMALNYARVAAFEVGIKPPATNVMPVWLDMGAV